MSSEQDADPSLLPDPRLDIRLILHFWFPLAASWLLMAAEMPTVTAFVARMPQTKLQLAAFGIATSLALAIESPIVPMLTASNALVRDRHSYNVVHRFMLGLNVLVTALMLSVSLTPLFDLVVIRVMGAPTEIAALVRPTLVAMSTWPAAIGYRRFFQGIMIRHGYTRRMSYGTAVRLFAALVVSAAGLGWRRWDGAMVGGLALATSTLAEAIVVHFLSRSAVRKTWAAELSDGEPPSDWRAMVRFYLPLVLTSMVNLSTTPLLNLGMARALYPVESLAVWPVISGQLLVTRSFGYSFQEVVVALLDRPGARSSLRRFAIYLGVGVVLLMGIIAFTPVGTWWQQRVAGLDAELTAFAIPTLRLVLLLPLMAVLQSWFRGLVIYGKRTGTIAGATFVNLSVLATALFIGVNTNGVIGVSLAAVALSASQGIESLWLWRRARLTERKR